MDNLVQEFFALYGATEILYNATKDNLIKLNPQAETSSKDLKLLKMHIKSLQSVLYSLTDSYNKNEPFYLTYPKKVKEKLNNFHSLTKKATKLIDEAKLFIEESYNSDNNVTV